jgi:hypothetical protein
VTDFCDETGQATRIVAARPALGDDSMEALVAIELST